METAVTDKIYIAATWLIPLAIAIVFHEVAHGRVAKFFGDPTASRMGRLSLNPIRHIDPFGTIILPLMLAVTGAPPFGWAKPVPVDPSRLRNPRWHMVLVAAAGPASNILLALLAAIFVGLFLKVGSSFGTAATSLFILQNLINFMAVNTFLALFNMIPLPPFDGSKILAGFLPNRIRQSFQNLDRYALFIMLGFLVVIPLLFPQANVVGRLIGPPASFLLEQFDKISVFASTL